MLKKTLLTFSLLLTFVFAAQAQELSPTAPASFGLR